MDPSKPYGPERDTMGPSRSHPSGDLSISGLRHVNYMTIHLLVTRRTCCEAAKCMHHHTRAWFWALECILHVRTIDQHCCQDVAAWDTSITQHMSKNRGSCVFCIL